MITMRRVKRLWQSALFLLAASTGASAQMFTAASGSPFGAGSSPASMAVGDFNGDGKPDLAIADATGDVTVLLGNGSGGFTAASGSPFTKGFPANADPTRLPSPTSMETATRISPSQIFWAGM